MTISVSIGEGAAPPARRWLTGLVLAGALVLALRALLAATSGASLHVDEAQYWDWSRHLAWGYYSKPPLVAALIAASTALFGDAEHGVRALAMLCWVLAGGVLALLARSVAAAAGRGDADAVGGWAAAGLWAGPLAALVGLVATTDAPLMLLWALALAAAWRIGQATTPAGRATAALALGLALGLGLLAKYTMVALLPGLLWWAWRYQRRCAPWLAAALALALLVAAPNIAWNAAADWPTWRHTAEITVLASRGADTGARAGGGVAGVLQYLAAQLLVAGPVLVPALAVALWRHRRAAPAARAAPAPPAAPTMPRAWRDLLLASAVPLLMVGLLQAGRSHAEANWVAPAHLSLVLAVAWAAPRWWPRAGTAIALVGGQLLLLTLLAAGASLALRAQPEAGVPAGLDPWLRMRGWQGALAALEPRLPADPALLVIGPTRTVLVHAAYHWRHRPFVRAAVGAGGLPSNHYELVCPWRPALAAGRPVVMLTEEPAPPGLGAGVPPPTLLASASRRPGRADAAKGPRLYLWRVEVPQTAGSAPVQTGLCR